MTVLQELNNNGGELIQAEIAKLHYMFENALKYSSRVNPLKKSIFLCLLFEFSLSLWLLLLYSAFTRTADCISYCHLQENNNGGFFAPRFLDILK